MSMSMSDLVENAVRGYVAWVASENGSETVETKLSGNNGSVIEYRNGNERLAGLMDGPKGCSSRTTLEYEIKTEEGRQGFRLNWDHSGKLCGIWFKFEDEKLARDLLEAAHRMLSDVDKIIDALKGKGQKDG